MKKVFFRKYILIRNIALVIILCNILYFIFPFAPIYWRISMLLLGIYMLINVDFQEITLFEKLGLSFLVLNIVYFFLSFLWLDNPRQTALGNTLFCMISLFLFCRLGAYGYLTQRYITVGAFALLIASILGYYHDLNLLLEYLDDEMTTINASTLFVVILPMALIFRKKYLSLIFLIVCISFILSSGKRGNIVAATIPIALFMILYLKENRKSFISYVIIIIASVFVYRYSTDLIIGSDFLQQRIEMTLEGNSSGRDIIYQKCWDVWYNYDSFVHFFWGLGWDGTIEATGGRAHNDWLELLVNHGLFGAVLYLLLFCSLLNTFFKTNGFQNKMIIATVFWIWFVKSIVSMGYTEEYLALLFISYGYTMLNKQ